MSLPAKYKMFNKDKMEKYYLRKAFDGYLPDELLWRRKEAFSDGVSKQTKPWYQTIQEHVSKNIFSHLNNEKNENLILKLIKILMKMLKF